MSIQQYAEKEMLRMKTVFEHVQIKDPANKQSVDFHDFAKNYFQDGIY
ncbi:hypothetical protein HYU13_00630 [Candidatus Woesearchaeota archaeon]|nr:hypothetical protein [Candidatus Woesearchaeota archaeon]